MWNYTKEIQIWLQDNPNGVIIVTGPTASGKTGVSIDLAQRINGEIINADSRQIYTDLTITTAAPTDDEKKNIPHHLFEYISPNKTYNVSEWRDDAVKKIKDIQSRKKNPILCGGTGLWINALTKNFSLGVEPNEAFREKMQAFSTPELFQKLKIKDVNQAKILGENNRKYIIRALEICEKKGNKTDYAITQKPEFPFFFIGTTWKREKLYDRINKRNEIMMNEGFLEEVQKFKKKFLDIPKYDSAFIAHGVPEALEYLNGKISLERMKEIMTQKTRNYAKRQLTWWRKDERVPFLDMENLKKVSIKNEGY